MSVCLSVCSEVGLSIRSVMIRNKNVFIDYHTLGVLSCLVLMFCVEDQNEK